MFALLALVTLAAAACYTPPAGPGGGGGGGPITITASSATINYGDAVPAITPSYAGLPSGHTATATLPTCVVAATSASPVGTYVTLCSGAVDGTSTITYVAGTLTINPAAVVVTASTDTMPLGGSVPTITASYSGLQNGETAPAVLPTCSTTATSSSAAGSYPSSCSGASDPNYTFTYVDGTVGVGTTLVTVTASSATTTYGDAAPAISASYSGFLLGETAPATPATCSTDATSASSVGSYTSTCSGAADPSYTFSYVDGTVDVGAAPVVVTASSATIPYLSTPPAIIASYSGLQNGDTAPATEPTCSTTATDTSPTGSYVSSCSGADDPNYTFTYVDGSIEITTGAIPVTVTASSATITYGDAVPTITPSYVGFAGAQTVPATTPATCSTTATTGSPAGTYPTTCSGASDPNYAFDYVAGTVTITPAAATVTASSDTFVYGGTVPAITASYSGLVNGDTAPATAPTCSTDATSASSVGSYTSTCSGAADSNYTFSTVDGTVDVTKAALVVTASSDTFVYGGSVPAITPSITGFVNGDTAPATAPTCSTVATSASPAGSYASSCSGADDPNYTFSYVDGSVSVTPAAAVVTASSDTVVYGTAPAITASYSGLVNGDTAPATAPTCSSVGTSVGSYASSCSGAADPNYTFTYVDGSVTVTPKAAVITASSDTFQIGDSVPAITASYSGLVNGDTAAATPPTCSTTATSAGPAGDYPSTCSGAADPNYTFTYVDGTVTVTAVALPVLTITASSADVEVGDAVPTITPSYSGLVGGDTAPDTAPTCTTAATTAAIGRSVSSCSGAIDADYDIVYVAGTVEVSPTAGIAAYNPTGVHTTTATAATALSAATFPVASGTGAGFPGFVTMTVQTTANGAQSYYCRTIAATSMGTCSANGAVGTTFAGAFVSDAPMNRFQVSTVAPGLNLASLTIVSDVAAANRGDAHAATTDGLVTYVQSGAPTGVNDVTYGVCKTGTATYTAADANCATGVIHYYPTIGSNIGDDVGPILGVTTNTYQNIQMAVVAPSTVPQGGTFKAYLVPSPGAIPHEQTAPILGTVVINGSNTFGSTWPIPAGFTVLSSRLIGGDQAANSIVTNCNAYATGACTALSPTSGTAQYANNSLPYMQLRGPTSSVVGGRQLTMPTVELTIQATGSSGTNGNFKLTEYKVVTATSLATATFDGYPTTGSNTGVKPPVGVPTILKTIGIS